MVLVAVALAIGGTPACCDRQNYSGTVWLDDTGKTRLSDVARELRLGSDVDILRLDYAFDMDRTFNGPPNKRSHSVGLLLQKAFLTIPLLRPDNATELAIRPRSELASALGRRVALQERKNQPRISVPEGVLAVDTHIHTSVSPDSLSSSTDVLFAAAKRGLSAIAITDHDRFEGAAATARAAQSLIAAGKLPADFVVIPGQEVSSSDGHVIALFITSRIPPGQSADWTVKAIHDQGGIAIAPHPLVPTGVGDLANRLPFDCVEVESASEKLHYMITPGLDRSARSAFYSALTKPRVGCSDSHDAETVGECHTLVTCAPTLEGLREAMRSGRVSAVATASESEVDAVSRQTVTRLLSAYRLLLNLNPLIPSLANSKAVSVSVLPCPAIRYCRKF